MHRSYLLRVTRDTFRPIASPAPDLELAVPGHWPRCRALWLDVGRGFWTARTRWDEARWRAHLRDPTVSFWIAREGDDDIGFFELVRKRRGVKLEGFGLLAPLRGQRRGGALLTAATQAAFISGADTVWLHMATDDHPSALPNYLARGYTIYQDRVLRNPMPSARKATPSLASR